jgi:hypothetical protein
MLTAQRQLASSVIRRAMGAALRASGNLHGKRTGETALLLTLIDMSVE